jgi:transposase
MSSVRERQALEKYLDGFEKADEQSQAVIDPSAVQAALGQLKHHPEPEARLMRTAGSFAPAYKVQTAIDAQLLWSWLMRRLWMRPTTVSWSRCPKPRRRRLSADTLNIVADAGYSNGEQAGRYEAAGLVPHVPANRAVNNQGDGTLFDRSLFLYQPESTASSARQARRCIENSFIAQIAPCSVRPRPPTAAPVR